MLINEPDIDLEQIEREIRKDVKPFYGLIVVIAVVFAIITTITYLKQ